MKFVSVKKPKGSAQRIGESPKVVLTINFDRIEKFQGFKYTVEEGKRLAKRSYTELPEFKKYASK
ncbi:hypothetical protein EJD96_16115 [Herbaspirillum seropedicae]|uniref:hypothetical protein n=1 Tax=Herbaspirillum seropedicae TaxID=964 RepID=UPI00111F7E72|nr:hypothetical protein [Herbaspirillum seropedicae]QDD65574.1 hypothetical protein EJD96_16115 [Herbaspirillum seropedicae]